MGFKDKLKDSLIGILTEKELSVLPRGFQTIGEVALIKLNPILKEKKNLIGSNHTHVSRNIKKSLFQKSFESKKLVVFGSWIIVDSDWKLHVQSCPKILRKEPYI